MRAKRITEPVGIELAPCLQAPSVPETDLKGVVQAQGEGPVFWKSQGKGSRGLSRFLVSLPISRAVRHTDL